MRHRISGFKLNRDSGGRAALFHSLIISLILRDKVVTTKAKAKAVRGQIEKLVSLAKKGKLSSSRRAGQILSNDEAVNRLTSNIVPRFTGRQSGFVRMIKIGSRVGDNAPKVQLEWVVPAPKVVAVKKEKVKKIAKVAKVPQVEKIERKKNVRKINKDR